MEKLNERDYLEKAGMKESIIFNPYRTNVENRVSS